MSCAMAYRQYQELCHKLAMAPEYDAQQWLYLWEYEGERILDLLGMARDSGYGEYRAACTALLQMPIGVKEWCAISENSRAFLLERLVRDSAPLRALHNIPQHVKDHW